MSVKINSLEIENVKRIKAVKLEPSANGLTIIGGNNNQGKTSVLDAIAWALGGDKYKPTAAARDGAYTDPILHVELSNGLIVERKGKNSSLKVIDPHGNKAGQQLLNSFLSALALDLPKFMHASDKEKAAILLQIIGIGDQLAQLEAEESRLYNQSCNAGRTSPVRLFLHQNSLQNSKRYWHETAKISESESMPFSMHRNSLLHRQPMTQPKNDWNRQNRMQGLHRCPHRICRTNLPLNWKRALRK